MPGSELPSREELVALVEQQARLIAVQAERIEALQAEVTQLQRRLGRLAQLLAAALVGRARRAGTALDPPGQRAPPR